MGRRFRRWLIAVVMLAYFMLPHGYPAAASRTVTVTIPAFPLTVNEVAVENSDSQYPWIVYQDITYAPMTYYDCRFLGLESVWSADRGLEIVRSGVRWDYHKYPSHTKNRASYTARVAAEAITVNGRPIDNGQEPYPFLVFRDITYFPLTWRFAVDEFGWTYAFDPSQGLLLKTAEGRETAAGQITLPIVTRANGEKGAFTLTNNFYYYEGEGGKIYQAPLDNPSSARAVYQLPLNDMAGTDYALASLKTEAGKSMLYYHTGGATMGADYRIWLRDDGSHQELNYGFSYAYAREFGEFTVVINQGVPPGGYNLYIRQSAGEDFREAGEPGYLYGWRWTYLGASAGGSHSDDLDMIGDDIYLLACDRRREPEDTTGIYRVNIKTNQTVRVCETPASDFIIDGDFIYFKDYYLEKNGDATEWSENGYLYRVPVAGGKAEKLTGTIRVSDYAVLDGQVYYVSLEHDDQLFRLGEKDPINPGGIVKSLEIQQDYLVAIFDRASTASCKMMIVNKKGQILFQTIEPVLMVRIDSGKVVFVKDE